MASIGQIPDIDFSQYDLDQPLPTLTTNGEQGSLDKFAQWGSGKTLRQLAMERFEAVEPELEFIGSPDTVAERVGLVMEAAGRGWVHGSKPLPPPNPRFIPGQHSCPGP